MNNLNSIAALDKPDYKFSSAQNGHIVRYNMGDGTIQDMGVMARLKQNNLRTAKLLLWRQTAKWKYR